MFLFLRRLLGNHPGLRFPVLALMLVLAFYSRLKNPTTYTRYLKDHEKYHREKANVPTICVVGAGFSGLAMCGGLTRWGISYDCYEADSALGGNWFHGVYETVHIISSRKTTEYKDFPMPESYPDFPSKDQVLEYLNSYADHFKLREHIKFNTEVKKVAPTSDERYEVTFADGTKKIYGGVIVCNGHHWDKRFGGPYPDEKTFSGEVMHSKDYKKPETLVGKRVLVLGGGNSACDIAAEAARFAESSHVSHRRGYWFMPRSLAGFPLVEYLDPMFPVFLVDPSPPPPSPPFLISQSFHSYFSATNSFPCDSPVRCRAVRGLRIAAPRSQFLGAPSHHQQRAPPVYQARKNQPTPGHQALLWRQDC